MMEKDSKIYVAGHRGLVGSAMVRELHAQGYQNLVLKTHAELDLTHQGEVADFFAQEKPEYVVLAAAKVGGIHANNTYPADFIYQNLAIQTNVIHQSYQVGVKRLLFLGSSCIYPRDCQQPIKEEYLLTGPLEPTNRPYALAKIAGIEMCSAYNRQYGTQFLAVMPTNLYGPGDNYHPENSHVIPALIRKIHEAKKDRKPSVVLWGTGRVRREFLYSGDLARSLFFLMTVQSEKFYTLLKSEIPTLNVGIGQDLTIFELAKKISDAIGFQGDFEFDITKPDGTPRKLLNCSKINQLGWIPQTSLEQGLRLAYQHYLNSLSSKLSLGTLETQRKYYV